MSGLSRSEVDAWLKAERDSLSAQVVSIIQGEFNALRLGVTVRPPLSEHYILVVPFILAWLLDHPEHMSVCACAHCGFCALGGLGDRGLVGGFATRYEPKSAARVHALLTEHAQAKAVAEAAPGGMKRAAGAALAAVEGKFKAEGMKVPPAKCLLLDQPYAHPFRGVSISILHCKKMAYHRVLNWNLAALWLAASQHSKAHAYDLVRGGDLNPGPSRARSLDPSDGFELREFQTGAMLSERACAGLARVTIREPYTLHCLLSLSSLLSLDSRVSRVCLLSLSRLSRLSYLLPPTYMT